MQGLISKREASMTGPMIRIAPSLLSADFAKLGSEIRALDESGADWIHIDIMDGHFVPNITIGPGVVRALRPVTNLPFDVHLMAAPVDNLIPKFAEAGADLITIHQEAGPHLNRSLQLIKSLGKKAGVSINPSTSAESLRFVMDSVDLILVMTVNPGFGGQSFIENQIEKIRTVKKMIVASERPIHLEVDGGVNRKNVTQITEAGADVIVAGTATFKGGPDCYRDNICQLRGA